MSAISSTSPSSPPLQADAASLHIQAVPSAPLSNPTALATGSATFLPAVQGSMSQAEPEKFGRGLMIRSGGRFYEIKFKDDAQQKKYDELHAELIAGSHPGALINVSRGYLEKDGHILTYLSENPDQAKRLHELRQLYHDALGQRFSDVLWHTYTPHDRASKEDPAPFQMRKDVEALKAVPPIAPKDCPKEQLKVFHAAEKLRTKIPDSIGKLMENIGFSTEAESRKKQLAATKEQFEQIDGVVTSFTAANPLPDLSKEGLTLQEKMTALSQYKEKAKEFLTDGIKDNYKTWRNKAPPLLRTKDWEDPKVKEEINKMAIEMALLACKTRKDHDDACLYFETQPCKTSPELFIIRLSTLIGEGAHSKTIETFLEQNFDIAFSSLSHKEDKDAIYDQIQRLIKEAKTDFADPKLAQARDSVAYHRRMEQLEIGRKQKALEEGHANLSKKLKKERPDLSQTADKIESLGKEQARLAAQLEGLDGEDASYHAIGEKISNTVVKTAAALIADLENQGNQDKLRGIRRELEEFKQIQEALAAHLSQKGKKVYLPGQNKIELQQIPTVE